MVALDHDGVIALRERASVPGCFHSLSLGGGDPADSVDQPRHFLLCGVTRTAGTHQSVLCLPQSFDQRCCIEVAIRDEDCFIGEGSYSQPAWSPRGDLLAFTKRKAGGFAIGVMKPDGSGERILTEGFHNEGPTWAPNGLYLMFFRDLGQGPQLWQVSIFGTPEVRVPTPGFASDPAWSASLSASR